LVEVHVAAKLVIALPLFAPGVNDTVRGPVAIVVDPGAALTEVGAAGGEPTITAADGAEARLAPRALCAVAVHVYVLPVVTVTVKGLAVPDFEPVTPPLAEVQVAVKLVIALPLLAPAVNDTVNGPVDVVVEPVTALTAVGGAGEPTTATDDADAALAPTPLVAFTVQA
jgi:hypothetical protein